MKMLRNHQKRVLDEECPRVLGAFCLATQPSGRKEDLFLPSVAPRRRKSHRVARRATDGNKARPVSLSAASRAPKGQVSSSPWEDLGNENPQRLSLLPLLSVFRAGGDEAFARENAAAPVWNARFPSQCVVPLPFVSRLVFSLCNDLLAPSSHFYLFRNRSDISLFFLLVTFFLHRTKY